MANAPEEIYSRKYAFMMVLQCTSEEEVAKAMASLTMPMVGLCLEGINISLMRMPEDEETSP